MLYETMFQFLVCSPALSVASLECLRLRQITEEVKRAGFQPLECQNLEQAELGVRTDASIGCILLEWGNGTWTAGAGKFVSFVRDRGLEMPIFILVRRHELEEIPVDTLGQVTGYVFLAEDSPNFIGRNLVSHLKQYANELKSPFFGAIWWISPSRATRSGPVQCQR